MLRPFFFVEWLEMCCLCVAIILVASYIIKKLFFDQNTDFD